jgi:glycosyltransferase involved in cell wall biosynthesis
MTPKIVHLSSSDSSGGAARAARRLHDGLLSIHADSKMLVASKTSTETAIFEAPPDRSFSGACLRRWETFLTKRRILSHSPSIAKGYELFSSDRVADKNRPFRNFPECDLVHLHWITWFVDYEAFFSKLDPNIPVVWTLHDMNVFTGGCHYDAGCERFIGRCGACPALDSTSPRDLSRKIFERKSRIFERYLKHRLHLVLPSRWLAEKVASSSLLGHFPRSVIPYSLDTDVFRPIEKRICRQVFNIPVDARVVLFVAESAENVRKGFSLLLAALERLRGVNGLFLISMGRPQAGTIEGIQHLPLGTVSNDAFLAAIYSAADVLVVPSLQDNLPNTVMEAMACGTPSVGFEAGGIPDMIRPHINGFLAPVGNSDALAERIEQALSSAAGNKMSSACRDIAVSEYGHAIQARRCVQLYESLMATKQKP